MEECKAFLVEHPAEEKGMWRARMPEATAIYVELGCGKGRFTVETAAQNPSVLFVAVERVLDAMVIAMERAAELGLTNVLFVDGDAGKLGDYFAQNEAQRIYLNFSDPWPANRQGKRRMTHIRFLEEYRKVLPLGGEIHFKTDNVGLFEWSLFQFPKAGYEVSQLTRDLHAHGVQGVMTDYEEKFHQQGMPINRCVATRVK